MKIEELTGLVLKHAFAVRTALGPGLLESSYKECLFYELNQHGIYTEKEKPMPLIFKEVKMDIGYRIDLMVENRIVVEIKCVDSFADIHLAQVITYLKLSGCKKGLLLNFKTTSLKNGIKSVAL